jgi:hypothetical protein
MKYYRLVLLIDNLSAFVRTANFAHAVRQFQFSAVVALDHAWNCKLKVSTALVAARLRSLSERYCHIPTSFNK